ncbi:hypothetical protein D3C86_1200290 [compost metagenome]
MIRAYIGLATNQKMAAVIGLHENAERVGLPGDGDDAGCSSDAALHAESHRAGSGSNAALGHRACGSVFQRCRNFLDGRASSADVVEAGIVGLSDDRIDRHHFFVTRLRQCVAVDRLDCPAGCKRIGEDDRRFEFAKFLDLGRACKFAEAVIDGEGGGHLVLKEVAAMRQDRGCAGADRVAFDDGRMADGHAFNIGDGIERAGLEMAGRQADIAQSRAGRLMHRAITFAECRLKVEQARLAKSFALT